MNFSKLTAAIFAASLCVGGVASATTVAADFDLTKGGNKYNQQSLSYSNNGLDLTVTGVVCLNGKGPNHSSCNNGKYQNGQPFDPRIDRSKSSGIYFNQPNDSDHEIDGDGYTDEFLKLSFSADTTFKSIKFSYWDSNDNALIHTTDGTSWTQVKNYGGNSSYYSFSTAYTGSMFLIGASGHNDEWKLKKISVTYEDHPSVVPLPAAGWMLLAGLGGLVATKRRKTA